jgi:hypothetical protein
MGFPQYDLMHEIIMSSTENKTPVKVPDSDKPSTPVTSSGPWDFRTPLTSPFEYFDCNWVRESETPSSPESLSPAARVVKSTKSAAPRTLIEFHRKRSADSNSDDHEKSHSSKRRRERANNAIRVDEFKEALFEKGRLHRERLELATRKAELQEMAKRKLGDLRLLNELKKAKGNGE